MTKPLTQKEQVAVFVRFQPNCAVGDVCEALDLTGAAAGRLLRTLADEGVITRTRNAVQYTYSAVPGASIPDVILPFMIQKGNPVQMLAAEKKAKELEGRGLWRRAASVYTGMLDIACSAVEVSRIAKRRNECLRMAGRA